MSYIVYKVMLRVEADVPELEMNEKVEWALNEACSMLEKYLPHERSIS